jgi:hypothetical protein
MQLSWPSNQFRMTHTPRKAQTEQEKVKSQRDAIEIHEVVVREVPSCHGQNLCCDARKHSSSGTDRERRETAEKDQT